MSRAPLAPFRSVRSRAAALALPLLAAALPGQNGLTSPLVTVETPMPATNGPILLTQHTGPHFLFTNGGPASIPGPMFPGFPVVPGEGGLAWDPVWRSYIGVSGFLVYWMDAPDWPSLGWQPPTALPPVVLQSLGSNATGIAVDPVTGRIHLSSANRIVALDRQTLMPVGTPITPNGYVPIDIGFSGSALAVFDASGNKRVLDATGAVLQFVPPATPLVSAAIDVAVDGPSGRTYALLQDRTMRALHATATYGTASGNVHAIAKGPGGLRRTNCSPSTWLNMSGPPVAGNSGFRIDLGGAAPNSLALLALSIAYSEQGVAQWASGCRLHLAPGPGILGFLTATTDPFGSARFSLPVPPGFRSSIPLSGQTGTISGGQATPHDAFQTEIWF